MERVAAYAHGDLLDIGCGHKPYLHMFNVQHYFGIDRPRGVYDQFDIAADASAIPFSDNSFDTVLSTEVLEHVSKPDRVIAEMVRILKPGGVVILSCPFLHPLHEAPYDYYRYSIYGLTFLFQDAGLEIICVQSRGGEGIVLADMCLRILVSTIKRFAGKLRFPHRLVNIFLYILVGLPQYAFTVLHTLVTIGKVVSDEALTNPRPYTLGHVVVARKK